MATEDTIQQRDNFHIHQEIIRDLQEDEHRRQIERLIAERRYNEVPIFLEYLKYECGGEEKTLEKIERLESYLSEGLPRYQDILAEQNRKIPDAPKGVEYKDPGIMESQIFTVLTKRFKSGRLSFSKFGATCLSKICAIKVECGTVEIEKIETEIQIDNSVEEYMKEIKERLRKSKEVSERTKKAEFERKKDDSIGSYQGLNIDYTDPIYQALKLVKISELDYII